MLTITYIWFDEASDIDETVWAELVKIHNSRIVKRISYTPERISYTPERQPKGISSDVSTKQNKPASVL